MGGGAARGEAQRHPSPPRRARPLGPRQPARAVTGGRPTEKERSSAAVGFPLPSSLDHVTDDGSWGTSRLRGDGTRRRASRPRVSSSRPHVRSSDRRSGEGCWALRGHMSRGWEHDARRRRPPPTRVLACPRRLRRGTRGDARRRGTGRRWERTRRGARGRVSSGGERRVTRRPAARFVHARVSVCSRPSRCVCVSVCEDPRARLHAVLRPLGLSGRLRWMVTCGVRACGARVTYVTVSATFTVCSRHLVCVCNTRVQTPDPKASRQPTKRWTVLEKGKDEKKVVFCFIFLIPD